MSPRNSLVSAALALVAVLGAFWFVALAPKRAEVAKLDDQIAQAQARRATAVSASATAEQARIAYQRDYATLARLGKAVPADEDVASLLYQVESLARANTIDFRSVRLVEGSTAPAAPAPSDVPAGKDTGKAATAKDTPSAPAIAQAPPGAAVGTAGLLTLPLSLAFDGSYLPMQRMLGAIDRLADATGGGISVRGRLLTVDGFSLTASRFGFPKVKALVSATAYMVPPAQGLTPGASPQSAAAGAAPPAAASGAGLAPPTATASTTGIG